ncbi:MAG: HK97-gp10 family putative phage morphogenesis protein [Anaerolineae bacterium]
MADVLQIKLDGIDALKAALSDVSEKIRKRAIRGALRDAARVIQTAARTAAPVLAAPTARRSPGTVRRNIVVRPSKFARRQGDEGVYVSVRGIRGKVRVARLGKAGASNPNDPYYWRFLEFGTRKMAARPFLGPAARSKGEEAIRIFMARVVPQIERLNRKSPGVR